MKRKNAFSYFMWFLYSIVVCVGLFATTATFSRQIGQAKGIGMVIGGVWLLLCGLFTWLIHWLKSKMNGKQIGGIQAIVAESLCVVILFTVGMLLRAYGMGNAETTSVYFELTKVAEGQSIPTVVHGAVYFYLQLLHLVYFVFGNKFVAGIWMQIVLQMLAGGFLYLTVRKISGVLSAVIMLAFFMLGPTMINQALILSPESLFLTLCAIILYVCGKCICDRKRLAACMVAGVLLSVTCYLDIMGSVLLLMTVAGILMIKNPTEDSLKRRIAGAILCVLSCVGGFVILMAVDSLASAKELGSVIGAWWRVFCPRIFDAIYTLGLEQVSVELILLVTFATIGIFSFWSQRKTERHSIWVLPGIALLLIKYLGMVTAEVNGMSLLYIIAAVCAGVGVTQLLVKESVAGSNAWEDGRLEAQLVAMSEDVEAVALEMQETEAESETEPAAQQEVLSEQQPELPKIQFIENPLPLPKKHVKKVMDFDLEIKAGFDDFDVDISENDDFDL